LITIYDYNRNGYFIGIMGRIKVMRLFGMEWGCDGFSWYG